MLYPKCHVILDLCQVWWQSDNSPVPGGRLRASWSKFLPCDVTSGFMTSLPIYLGHHRGSPLDSCQVWWQSDNFPVAGGQLSVSWSRCLPCDVTSGFMTSLPICLDHPRDSPVGSCQIGWQSDNYPVLDGRLRVSWRKILPCDVTSGFMTSLPISLGHPRGSSLGSYQIWWRLDYLFGCLRAP